MHKDGGWIKLSESDFLRLEFDWNLALGIWSLPLGRSIPDDHQHDAPDQANTAEHRRKRDRFLLFSSRLNGAEIEHLFALGVRDPAVSERDNADND